MGAVQAGATPGPITTALAEHLAGARERELPEAVVERAKQHTLDTLAAIISGSTLEPGRRATDFVASRAAVGSSTLVGPGTTTAPELAALANGMSAHADESDDVNDLARIHPGASVVPAALAMGEDRAVSGQDLLRAVSCGYDVGCSMTVALFGSLTVMQQQVRSTHGIGQTFGAMAAAAALSGLDVERLRYVLSYTAQQVSGMFSFYRDQHHVGKAFASAGMQASNGVRAVEMVRAGFTDIADVFDTSPNVFDAFGVNADPQRLLHELASMHYVAETDMKQYPVGMPIQAAAQGLALLLARPDVSADDVDRIECRLPSHGARITDNRNMPDIHLQYVLAVMLMDGDVTFASSHDYERHRSPETRAVIDRVTLIHDPLLDPPHRPNTRIAVVTIHTKDGREITENVDAAHGSRLNPMDWPPIERKARDVLSVALEPDRADALIATVRSLEQMTDVRELRPFLTVRR